MSKVVAFIAGLVILSAALYAVAGDSINDMLNGESTANEPVQNTESAVVADSDTTSSGTIDDQEITASGAGNIETDTITSSLYGPDYRFVEITDSPLLALYGDDISGYQRHYTDSGLEIHHSSTTLFDPVQGGDYLFYRAEYDDFETLTQHMKGDIPAIQALHGGETPVKVTVDLINPQSYSPEMDAAVDNMIELRGTDPKYTHAALTLTYADGSTETEKFTNLGTRPQDYLNAWINPGISADYEETMITDLKYTKDFYAAANEILSLTEAITEFSVIDLIFIVPTIARCCSIRSNYSILSGTRTRRPQDELTLDLVDILVPSARHHQKNHND
ncbi:MAG: hypothetical protein R2741_01910 [Methanolobus sp.]